MRYIELIRDARRAFHYSNGEREPATRLPLAFFGGSAINIYCISHMLVGTDREYAGEDLLASLARVSSEQTAWAVLGLSIVCSVLCSTLLLRAENALHMKRVLPFVRLGARCVGWGLSVSVVTGVTAIAATGFCKSLLNPWDQGFLWVAIAIQYIGTWFYLYNSAPLGSLLAPREDLALRQIEMLWDQQKMYLRAFAIIIVTILVGQVFAVMKLKYGNILESGGDFGVHDRASIVVNAGQLAFLLLGWWGLVFSRILRRMEMLTIAVGAIAEQGK